MFTARRVWDQQTEYDFMKDIEDQYQKLADKAADGRINRLDSEDNQTITDMYALWNIRFHWSQQSIPDQEVKGIHDVTRKLSKSNQEYLEKNSVIPIRPDFKISGRHIVGINVFRNLDMVREKMQGTKWGIIETKGVEFIVPDKAPQNTIMPLTPLLCFWPKNEYLAINDYDVARINHISVQDSENYYFARNLSCCPISNKIGH